MRLCVSTPALRARLWESQYTTQEAIAEVLCGASEDPEYRFRVWISAGVCPSAATAALIRWAGGERTHAPRQADGTGPRHRGRGGRGRGGRGRGLDTLVKFMEDHRDEVVFIGAGYTDEMGGFLAANPGLASRFSRTITFGPYGPDELSTSSSASRSPPASTFPGRVAGRSLAGLAGARRDAESDQEAAFPLVRLRGPAELGRRPVRVVWTRRSAAAGSCRLVAAARA